MILWFVYFPYMNVSKSIHNLDLPIPPSFSLNFSLLVGCSTPSTISQVEAGIIPKRKFHRQLKNIGETTKNIRETMYNVFYVYQIILHNWQLGKNINDYLFSNILKCPWKLIFSSMKVKSKHHHTVHHHSNSITTNFFLDHHMD